MENYYCFTHLSRKELRHAIKHADSKIFDDAIRYLEDDPNTFGSGYIKEILWKYIRRYDLKTQHILRLENADLKYLHRPMSHEYKYMCQTMCRIARDEFWIRVRNECLASDNKWVKINTLCLIPYSQGMEVGETYRLAWRYSSIRATYNNHQSQFR